jgi:hypothetical protein
MERDQAWGKRGLMADATYVQQEGRRSTTPPAVGRPAEGKDKDGPTSRPLCLPHVVQHGVGVKVEACSDAADALGPERALGVHKGHLHACGSEGRGKAGARQHGR